MVFDGGGDMKSEDQTVSPHDRSGFRQKAVFFDFKRIAALCRDAATTDGWLGSELRMGFPFLLALAVGRVLTLGNNQPARSL
jgi:hypothetical protein